MATNIQKKRAVVSYENMSPELAAAFNEKYPRGYADYMEDIIKIDKPNGTFFHAVSIEIQDAIYLVKVKVKMDDIEDVENWLSRDTSEESSAPAAEDGDFPAEESDFDVPEGGDEDSDS